jgi:hypothetical protein
MLDINHQVRKEAEEKAKKEAEEKAKKEAKEEAEEEAKSLVGEELAALKDKMHALELALKDEEVKRLKAEAALAKAGGAAGSMEVSEDGGPGDSRASAGGVGSLSSNGAPSGTMWLLCPVSLARPLRDVVMAFASSQRNAALRSGHLLGAGTRHRVHETLRSSRCDAPPTGTPKSVSTKTVSTPKIVTAGFSTAKSATTPTGADDYDEVSPPPTPPPPHPLSTPPTPTSGADGYDEVSA